MQALITAMLYIVVQKGSARVLIIVPANVLKNWMQEIAKWLKLFTGRQAEHHEKGIRLVYSPALPPKNSYP